MIIFETLFVFLVKYIKRPPPFCERKPFFILFGYIMRFLSDYISFAASASYLAAACFSASAKSSFALSGNIMFSAE